MTYNITLNSLSKNEQDEFDDLVSIIENVTGLRYSPNIDLVCGYVFVGDCKELLARMRYLIVKNEQLEEYADVRGKYGIVSMPC